MKKEIVGNVVEGGGIWFFETEDNVYSDGICSAIDELLDSETESGQKIKITIEVL